MELDKTVRENLRTAMQPIQDLVDRFNAISARMADPEEADNFDKLMDEMGRLQEQIDACNGWEIERMMDIASDALVLPPDNAPVRQLSGGERRRVALCMALLEKPDLLLLDEPTNHLDAETVQWLEQALREYPGTVIIVTHDRYFLDNITKWILELENGRGLPFEGNYTSWLEQKIELLRVIGEEGVPAAKDLAARIGLDSQLAARAAAEEPGPHQAYEQLAGQKQIDTSSEAIIQIAPGPRLGEKVLTFKASTRRSRPAARSLNLIEDCSFNVPRGASWA